jgi:hypothetical protein
MRILSLVVCIIVLASCATTGEYSRVSRELHFQKQGRFCWIRAVYSNIPRGVKCTPPDAGMDDELLCWSELVAKKHSRLITTSDLQQCMWDKGWGIYLLRPPRNPEA